ncbi:hypothetical protein [Candidatus Corynebacterium faecigallinarum]|uniref:hypothetical protein n=1 Tax=Candidatus Corynebacterium faecigallinarum TaxID=2838528 RepID=UPI003FD44868
MKVAKTFSGSVGVSALFSVSASASVSASGRVSVACVGRCDRVDREASRASCRFSASCCDSASSVNADSPALAGADLDHP